MKDGIVILGTAPTLEADLARLPRPDAWDYCAVGLDCSDRYLGRIEHAVSYHPREFPDFKDRRAKAGGNLDYLAWTHNDPARFADRVLEGYFSPSGSSAMLGVEVALHLGYARILVCGVALLDGGYRRFQAGWQARLDKIKNKTRAMSGYPLELLGDPDDAWLEVAP